MVPLDPFSFREKREKTRSRGNSKIPIGESTIILGPKQESVRRFVYLCHYKKVDATPRNDPPENDAVPLQNADTRTIIISLSGDGGEEPQRTLISADRFGHRRGTARATHDDLLLTQMCSSVE